MVLRFQIFFVKPPPRHTLLIYYYKGIEGLSPPTPQGLYPFPFVIPDPNMSDTHSDALSV